MGTSTSKVGETETGRGGHGKGATKRSDEHEEEPEHWERQHDGYKTTTKDKDNYDKGMATKTRQLRGQWQRTRREDMERSKDTTKPTGTEADLD